MSERFTLGTDSEWLDISEETKGAVVRYAMENDLTFGEAFTRYVSENFGGGA